GGLPASLSFHQHAHEVAFLHDQVLNTIELDLGPRPFPEQHAVADFHVDGDEFAGLIAPARTDGDDLALLRFFLCRIRDDDAACPLLFSLDALDDDAIVKRTEFHDPPPNSL